MTDQMSRIKAYRYHIDMSQQELAAALGIFEGQLANCENGLRIPRQATVTKFKNFYSKYGITVNPMDFVTLYDPELPDLDEMVKTEPLEETERISNTETGEINGN